MSQTIRLNGLDRDLRPGTYVQQLLDELGLCRDRVAIELNLDILPKDNFESHLLQPGDSLEIVQFVGGG